LSPEQTWVAAVRLDVVNNHRWLEHAVFLACAAKRMLSEERRACLFPFRAITTRVRAASLTVISAATLLRRRNMRGPEHRGLIWHWHDLMGFLDLISSF
jgi:hypothetical protein